MTHFPSFSSALPRFQPTTAMWMRACCCAHFAAHSPPRALLCCACVSCRVGQPWFSSPSRSQATCCAPLGLPCSWSSGSLSGAEAFSTTFCGFQTVRRTCQSGASRLDPSRRAWTRRSGKRRQPAGRGPASLTSSRLGGLFPSSEGLSAAAHRCRQSQSRPLGPRPRSSVQGNSRREWGRRW
jgi:hypothetical protein